MNLILIDDDSNTYNFPVEFWYTSMPYTRNRSYEHRTNSAGAVDIADGMPKERLITIEGHIIADSLAAFTTADDNLKDACNKGGKLYLSDIPTRYMDIRLQDINQNMGQHRWHSVYSILFTASIPFWQDNTETEAENIMAGNGNFVVNYSGSKWIFVPEIKVEADQAANLPSITITNTTDSNKSFTYTNAGFTVGKTFIINGRTGVVTLDGVDDFANMVAPWEYLRLLNKSNTFSYTGNACTITVTYRKLYT